MSDTGFNEKVSMIGALPPLKGNAYYSMSLAREMAERIAVDFVTFKKLYPEFLYPGGVSDNDPQFVITETSSLSIRRIITYYNPWTWLRAGFAVHAKVVHLQWWSIPLAPMYIVLLLVLKLRRKRIVLTVHNVLPHEASSIDRIATKAVLAFGDGLIVHSESNRKGLVTYFRLPRKRIYKVHMPVHDMYGGHNLTQAEARRRIGVPENAKIILSFGNMREYKGIDCLIESLAKVQNTVPLVRLLIVGQPWSNWHDCAQLIKSLGLTDHVTTVLEYIPMSAVGQYFVASDVVALPYRRFDAQSGVGNIALAYSLPMVVTRVGGLPDLVQDERVVAEPNDPDSLSRALSAVLVNEALYEKLQRDAEALKEKYSWSAAVDATLEIYRNFAEYSQGF